MKKKFFILFKYLSPRKLLLFLLIIYISLLVIPYVSHKKVSVGYQRQFHSKEFYSDTVGSERVSYINDNSDALLYRLNMIESAKEEVILSTFDFNPSKSGKDVMSALIHAAKRGVSVRVIVDGCSGFLDLYGNEYFQALASYPNISIRIYNPINLLKPYDLQARLHDKYVIIDHQMYLLGGRNTTNLFLGDYSSSKNIDRELFVYNTKEKNTSSLSQLRSYFESVWALPDSKNYLCQKETSNIIKAKKDLENRYDYLRKTYKQAYEKWNFEELTLPTNKITLLSNPIETENKEPLLWYSLQQLMLDSTHVTIYTPYIICGKEMYQGFTDLNKKGIPVEIITNDVASGANPWGCTDYLNQKEKIQKTGIKVYEFMGKYSCHTKALLLDERLSIVGSYNFDMRSTYQDTELMLVVDCPELNSIIRKEAERDKTYSKTMEKNGEYTYGKNYKEKNLSIGKKIFYGVLRVIVLPIRRFL